MDPEYTVSDLKLSSAEVSQLWTTYIANSMSECVLSHFIETAEDLEVSSVVKYGLDLSTKYMSNVKDILSKEGFPIPMGFSKKDVNLKAEKLFSDSFMLSYIKYLTEIGAINYGMSLTVCVRKDVRDFFTCCIDTTSKLLNMLVDTQLEKSMIVPYPYIPVPDEVEFVTKKGFVNSLLLNKRPLNSSEVTNVFHDIQAISLVRALQIAFIQTTKSEEIKNYLSKGLDLSKSHINTLSDILREDDLPVPMTLESQIFDSKETPFSDKLMLLHITSLMGYKTAIFGISMAASTRVDVYATYAKLVADVGGYAKDGMDILIKNGWLEKNPEAADRKELAKF